jgi:Plavaka transposase
VGDYPEQLLVTCCKYGHCLKCTIEPILLGEDIQGTPCNLQEVLDALNTIDDGPTAYAQACAAAGIKPIQHPFWRNLPFLNIFCSVTPDILHQLYQELIKHILLWLKNIYGAKEIDTRCC